MTDPATLAHAVLDTVVPDVPWKIQLQEFQVRAAAAPTLARAVIDLTAKVELRDKALEAVLAMHTPKDNGRVSPCCSCEQWIESSDDEACIEYPCPTVEAITTALEATK